MPIETAFNEIKSDDVRGYLISTEYTPMQGLQDDFFVYEVLRFTAATHLTPLRFDRTGPAQVNTLTITGDNRSYTFPQITHVSAEPGVSRRERYQVLEFQYPHTAGVANKVPAVLKNSSPIELQQTALDKDYTYGLDQFPEQLLGFQVRQSRTDGTVVRFAVLRNAKNSFLEKIIHVHNAQQQHGERQMQPFTIRFAQGNIEVNRANLVRAHVVEAYGECLTWRLPDLAEYLQAGGGSMARMTPTAYSPVTLLQHEVHREFPPAAPSYTVEIATFVFLPGTINLAIR